MFSLSLDITPGDLFITIVSLILVIPSIKKMINATSLADIKSNVQDRVRKNQALPRMPVLATVSIAILSPITLLVTYFALISPNTVIIDSMFSQIHLWSLIPLFLSATIVFIGSLALLFTAKYYFYLAMKKAK